MIFLKLGGSLITDKSQPEIPRVRVIRQLAEEILQSLVENPETPLLVGHGSGSFGHQAAAKYGTHKGASSVEDWIGFTEVWASAQQLNLIVMAALRRVGVAALSFPPSASALCEDGEIVDLSIGPIERALESGLTPVVYGDVGFDIAQGACIISTEQVFNYLAPRLRPQRVLLAGIEPGVYVDYPRSEQVLPQLAPEDLRHIRLEAASEVDVTGGMGDKVRQAFSLASALPDSQVRIFSAEEPGALLAALRGEQLGTLIVRKRLD
jgi:isopentenyl phosphate kinase